MGFAEGHKTEKNLLKKDVTFLDKSFGELNKIENLTEVLVSYEGSDDEEVKVILGNNESYNVNCNVVSNFEATMQKKKTFLRIKLRMTLK